MSFFSRLSSFLLASVLVLVMAQTAYAREMVSVARAEVNMRSGPGTRHETQWTLVRGYPLSVLGRQGRWLKVKDFENDRGWILGSLVDRTPHVIVKTRVANLRGAPGTHGRLVGKAVYGDVMKNLERRGAWIKVRHEKGATGWVSRNLVWGW